MVHDMTAVVEHDVGCAELLEHGSQEGGVGLVTDADGNLVLLVGFASLLDVDPDDLGMGT